MGLEDVGSVQQQAHRRSVGLALALAQRVEQGLHLVRGVGELGEAEGAAATLDRVRGAEDRVERLRVRPALAELHRVLLDRLEVLVRLVEEGGDEAA